MRGEVRKMLAGGGQSSMRTGGGWKRLVMWGVERVGDIGILMNSHCYHFCWRLSMALKVFGDGCGVADVHAVCGLAGSYLLSRCSKTQLSRTPNAEDLCKLRQHVTADMKNNAERLSSTLEER